jgi:hypothetical protein
MKQILSSLGLVTQGDEHAWAVTSPDDRYRYVLGRTWDDYFENGRELWEMDPARPLWSFCMLNPSKARHDIDDHTMRKCVGFARRGGAGGILIVNLFAFSATLVKDLVQASRDGIDVVGPKNLGVLQWATAQPARLGRSIVAWGKIPPRLRDTAMQSRGNATVGEVYCLGHNADGSPKHPLRLWYGTELVPFVSNAYEGGL